MKRFLILLSLGVLGFGCAGPESDKPPLQTVASVDLARYLGQWYEIASYPNRFQRDCTATTADYSRLPSGAIRVINRCRKGDPEGPLAEAVGQAEIADPATNAKLKVSFFWPFKGNYWIIDLDKDYQWAVVGEPSRRYLWILNRTPTMDDALYTAIVARLPAKGYDPQRLQRTQHQAAPGGY